jgi:hypothetical protein
VTFIIVWNSWWYMCCLPEMLSKLTNEKIVLRVILSPILKLNDHLRSNWQWHGRTVYLNLHWDLTLLVAILLLWFSIFLRYDMRCSVKTFIMETSLLLLNTPSVPKYKQKVVNKSGCIWYKFLTKYIKFLWLIFAYIYFRTEGVSLLWRFKYVCVLQTGRNYGDIWWNV